MDDGSFDGKDKSGQRKWFNLNPKGADKKAWLRRCLGYWPRLVQ